ncbi:protein [Lichtheimia corymbifera JMRC:FSU:9682]|uniref:Protein n=1 Tax=Lichtheimia corymbifera JMRC:FSU:9682 TaxID=1263082 RepID=A0A068SBB7_9FUNG|nr:protein [Lichtheimia corymbifera JMRC:FSU:9682]
MATALTANESTTTPSSARSSKPAKKTECLIPASRFIYNGSEFEYTVYSPSTRFMREMDTVFPQLSVRQRKELLVIPIVQRCKHDLVGSTPEIEEEREFKLENFIEWGGRMIDRLHSLGMWADLTDPASGFPLRSTPGPSPYPDVQATHALTHYDIQNVGCCHIMLHPAWKSHIYPGTFFTTAPADIFVKVLNEQLLQQQ